MHIEKEIDQSANKWLPLVDFASSYLRAQTGEFKLGSSKKYFLWMLQLDHLRKY